MAESSNPYPPDQFDREADLATFHGAHRAEDPFWKQNLVYILIIAAAFVTLLVLLFAINGVGGNGRDAAEDSGASPTSAAPSSEQPSESAEPAAEPDRATPVLVINAGGINGLAGRWQDQLTEAGWEKVDVSTADSRQEEPVVFYRDEADQATAQALAQEVGAGEAQQSDEYEGRITFLAVNDPEGGDGGGDGGGEDGEG